MYIYNFIIYLFISDEKIQGTVSLISVSTAFSVSSPEQEVFWKFLQYCPKVSYQYLRISK